MKHGLWKAVGVICLLSWGWMMLVTHIDVRPWARRVVTKPRAEISNELVEITDGMRWFTFSTGMFLCLMFWHEPKSDKK